jgi:hypothetical protein
MAVLEIASNSGSAKPIGTVAVHYRMPGGFVDSETRFSCSNHHVRYDSLDQNLKKAINLVMLGMKLKYSAYAKRISWDYIEKNALKVFNSKEAMDLQYQQLVEKARKIYRKKAKF